MEFLAQSPTDDDIGFDRDDLVGISLLGDDPIFKKGISIENMYKCVQGHVVGFPRQCDVSCSADHQLQIADRQFFEVDVTRTQILNLHA